MESENLQPRILAPIPALARGLALSIKPDAKAAALRRLGVAFDLANGVMGMFADGVGTRQAQRTGNLRPTCVHVA